jgi:hypothetical protein
LGFGLGFMLIAVAVVEADPSRVRAELRLKTHLAKGWR